MDFQHSAEVSKLCCDGQSHHLERLLLLQSWEAWSSGIPARAVCQAKVWRAAWQAKKGVFFNFFLWSNHPESEWKCCHSIKTFQKTVTWVDGASINSAVFWNEAQQNSPPVQQLTCKWDVVLSHLSKPGDQVLPRQKNTIFFSSHSSSSHIPVLPAPRGLTEHHWALLTPIHVLLIQKEVHWQGSGGTLPNTWPGHYKSFTSFLSLFWDGQ